MPNRDSIVHGLNTYTDTSTGKRYAYGTDEEVTDHLDEETKKQLLKQLAPRQAGVVGNFADVQRGGAAVLKDEGTMSAGVEPPPDRTKESVKRDAKVAEKVEEALDSTIASVDAALNEEPTTKKAASKSSSTDK